MRASRKFAARAGAAKMAAARQPMPANRSCNYTAASACRRRRRAARRRAGALPPRLQRSKIPIACAALISAGFRQHGDAAGHVKAADTDRQSGREKRLGQINRARKLVRLHADQPDQASARLRGGSCRMILLRSDPPVGLVISVQADLDAGPRTCAPARRPPPARSGRRACWRGSPSPAGMGRLRFTDAGARAQNGLLKPVTAFACDPKRTKSEAGAVVAAVNSA